MLGRMFQPAHSGEDLKEFLPPDLTVTEAAQRLGVSVARRNACAVRLQAA